MGTVTNNKTWVRIVNSDLFALTEITTTQQISVGELGTTLAVTSNRRTLRRNTAAASVASYG
jgi:hypothetical protein